jgi:hypothetical protein
MLFLNWPYESVSGLAACKTSLLPAFVPTTKESFGRLLRNPMNSDSLRDYRFIFSIAFKARTIDAM